MPQPVEDDTGLLERARERLYIPGVTIHDVRAPMAASDKPSLPHAWKEDSIPDVLPPRRARQVHVAGIFFMASFIFFLVSLGGVGYFFYYGGNSVSIDKIAIDIQGPTTIAGGDTVPLSLTVTNKNAVAIENVTIEIDFPSSARSATDVLSPYPRYVETLGTLASGATITRSVKAVMFGGEGQSLTLPISLSYSTAGSNAVFVKKTSYILAISSTPLSLSVDTPTETVSGKLVTLTLSVRSNATTPLSDVVLTPSFPFGFSIASSSIQIQNSSFFIGTMLPGASKTITVTGRLVGQDKEQRVFRFAVGTAKTTQDHTLGIAYVTQEATMTIAAPFINTSITINGDTRDSAVVSSGSSQNVTVSYVNTLPTSVTNATIEIKISGPAVDYESIRTQSGFYRSADRTIVFSRDTESTLAMLAPGASGTGSFTFSTLPLDAIISAPVITFTASVSGTRVGQSNVPEQVSASVIKTAKVSTAVALSAFALHSSGPLSTSGPIPPRVNMPTTYTIVWNVQNKGSAIADGSVSATLPSYVSYTDATAGVGSFSYNKAAHTVSWNVGDLAQGASAQGVFQVSLTPSTSQKGTAPALTGGVSFSGYDRFAGITIKGTADPATTDTKGDPGYVGANAIVQ